MVLISSGDIELNPGPIDRNQIKKGDFEVFNNKGLHFMHLNINGLLNKIDELRYIARSSNAAVTGITETKLGNIVYDSEVTVDGYNIVIGNDRNRNGGDIFTDLLFPKTKPISVCIIYKPPSQSQFLQQIITEFEALDLDNEIYVLGDFNINLLFQDKYILSKSNVIKNLDKNLLPEIRRYKEFCSIYGLSQLIDSPTRITSNTSNLIDHILTNTQENISQSGVIDTAISDHSLIYCTRKIPRTKYNRHKEITFCSLKNYLPDVYKGTLERVSFPNYENFDNPDVTCIDFITWLDCAINALALFKTVRIKNNASEWFDGEIAEKIHARDKIYKKFKSTKLHVDEEIYKEA